MPDRALPDLTKEIAQLLHSQLGVRRGRTLEDKLRRGERLLPRKLRAEARLLVENERRMGHPKLQMQIDHARMAAAHGALVEHLKAIDPLDRWKGRILGILAVIAFNFLLIFAGVVTWMVWTDRL